MFVFVFIRLAHFIFPLHSLCLIRFHNTTQTIYENRYVMLYNVIFTSVPGLIVGFTDQDVSDKMALKFPQLYR